MKVLHVITESNLGGAQRNTLLTMRGLVRRGCRVHLACGPHGPGDAAALIRESERLGVEVHPISSLVRRISVTKDLAAAWALARLMGREEFDVVHTHSTKAGIFGRLAAWSLGVPVVIHTFHGVPFDTRRENWKTRLCFGVERVLCRFCDSLVSVGEVLRDELLARRVAPAGKIVTIHSGVDFAELDCRGDQGLVRDALGLPAGVPVVGFVGRLAEQKAPEVLLHAFSTVRREVPGAHLVFVGEGPLREALRAEAEELGIGGCVHLLGERGDVPELLSAMTVFALPSRWEGVGRALTEAMYLGLPVVSTGVNGAAELVQDGVTGLVAKGDDPADLAEKILRLIRDEPLARRLGQAARARVVERMSAETMVDATARLYEKLLAERSPRAAGRGGTCVRHLWQGEP